MCRFKTIYSALPPSTTHFVERGVKIAGISSNSKQSDTRASHNAIGSNLTEEVNRVTIEKMKSNFEYKNEEAIVPRGKVFSKHLLAKVEEMDTDINKLFLDEGKASVYKEMHTRLNKKKLAFRHDLAKFAVDAGDKQQQKRKGMKAPKVSLVRAQQRKEKQHSNTRRLHNYSLQSFCFCTSPFKQCLIHPSIQCMFLQQFISKSWCSRCNVVIIISRKGTYEGRTL